MAATPAKKSDGPKPWLRLYWEWMNDPKVQMMSEADQRRLLMLFCLRGSGEVEPTDELIIFTLRISPEEWERSKALFIEKGFISPKNRLLNWEKRQYESDISTSRVREYRDKKKAMKQGETEMKRFRNANETPPDNRVQNTETEEDPPISPQGDGEGDHPASSAPPSDGLPPFSGELARAITEAYGRILVPAGWQPFGGWYDKLIRQIRVCIGEKPARASPEFWEEHFNRIRGSDFPNSAKFNSKSIVWATKPETVGKIENGMWQGGEDAKRSSLEEDWEFLNRLDGEPEIDDDG